MAKMDEAANIVRDAGGKLVGRTRFQKLAFLLEVSGLGNGFEFDYHRFGPFSDELNSAIHDAQFFDLLVEEEVPTSWGGTYSIFTTDLILQTNVAEARVKLARMASTVDTVELELAATAVFLALEGYPHPWDEVSRRKPDKAVGGRIEKAKLLYNRLRTIDTPVALPEIV